MADYVLRYDDELHKKAKIQAIQEGITLKDLIIKALTEYLKKKGVKQFTSVTVRQKVKGHHQSQ